MAIKDFKGFKKGNDTYKVKDERADNLGTASKKNSTSVVAQGSTDLVESGAVKDIVGWGNANKLPSVIWHLNNTSTFDGSTSDANPIRTRTTPAFEFPFPSQTFEISGLPSCITALNGVKCFDSAKTEIGMAQVSGYKFTTLANTAYIYILFNGEDITVADMANAQIMVCPEGTTPTSYEPYHASVEESLDDKLSYEDNTVLGVKNLLDPNLQTGELLTVNITNTNGILTLNGTSTGDTNNFAIKSRNTSGKYIYLPKGIYIYSAEGIGKGVIVGTTYNNAFTEIARNNNGDNITFSITDSTQSDYKLDDGSVLVGLYITIESGKTYNNQKVYPMIRLASDTDPTYQPHAQTNRELTVNKADNSVIGTVERANASKAWSAGEHFIKDGQFKEVTQPITSGGAINDSNTVDRPIADCLIKRGVITATTSAAGNITIDNVGNKIILSAYTTNVTNTLVFPFKLDSPNRSYVQIRNRDTMEILGETEFTVKYFYIEV